MRKLLILIGGIIFGIIMTKSEAISWFRIQEMFRFQSIHMYGIIGVAAVGGALMVYLMKKFKFKNIDGEVIQFPDKPKTYYASLLGGSLFGLGWAMTGACPGPLYVLIGNGYLVIIVVILAALLGTYTYGRLKSKLPH